jgi:glutamate N-acetyltransferase / amino-acid N-acetyltransferase
LTFPPVGRTDWIGAPDGLALLPGGSVTTPDGFVASGVACGLKESGNRDLGILASMRPAVSGLVLTINAIPAEAIVRAKTLDPGGLCAIVVNSGNANAATGAQGLADTNEMGQRAAAGLGMDPAAMLTASTGVIGRRFQMDVVRRGIDLAVAGMSADGGPHFAEAICTTDRAPKAGAFTLELSSGAVTIGVASKGAGMIRPTMATMLCFVSTDASLRAEDLQRATASATQGSFNRISVDGQMSPSDTLLVIANGQGSPILGDDLARFTRGLTAVCRWSAIQMVLDGEGAEHAVRLVVEGATTDTEADRVARAIGDSPLVKSAIYGRDANWGRISQAVGQALIGSEGPTEFSLSFDGRAADDADVGAVMALTEYDIAVTLGRGPGRSDLWVSDLTHAYVSLNADYTT